jgi:hypothetical protein
MTSPCSESAVATGASIQMRLSKHATSFAAKSLGGFMSMRFALSHLQLAYVESVG